MEREDQLNSAPLSRNGSQPREL